VERIGIEVQKRYARAREIGLGEEDETKRR